MNSVSSLVDVLVTHKVDAAMVAQVGVDLVRAWSGGVILSCRCPKRHRRLHRNSPLSC
jgi:hypothetical protein